MKEFFTLHVSPIEEYFRGNHDDDDDDDEEEVFNLLLKAGIKNIETMFPSLKDFLKRQELFAQRLSKLVCTWKPKTTLLAIGATIYEFRDMLEMYKRIRSARVTREKIATKCMTIARNEKWELDLGKDLSVLVLPVPVRSVHQITKNVTRITLNYMTLEYYEYLSPHLNTGT